MSYKTYAEAKIANPDSEIVTTGKNWSCHYSDQRVGTFEKQGSHIIRDNAWIICNPADYCSTVEEFLSAGFRLVRGDWVIKLGGVADNVRLPSAMNCSDFNDHKRYILSAAALNGGCKIPVKAEQWTVYNNTLPLCELTDEQAAMLFNVWRKGFEIENCLYDEKHEEFVWVNCFSVLSNIEGVYRIKSKSERELFIDDALDTYDGRTGLSESAMTLAAGMMFDSGKFKLVNGGE